jgi:hypothetical protein
MRIIHGTKLNLWWQTRVLNSEWTRKHDVKTVLVWPSLPSLNDGIAGSQLCVKKWTQLLTQLINTLFIHRVHTRAA